MPDVSREEFDALKTDVHRISEENAVVIRIVAGGIDMDTGEVKKGLVQSVNDLVTELDQIQTGVRSAFTRASRVGADVVRVAVPVIGTALLGGVSWLLHAAWPAIQHSLGAK
jgi:hypothetical protein